jgi:transketolase
MVETAVAWKCAIERADGPSVLALTRQALPHNARTAEQIAAISRGGYVLKDCAGTPEAILIATGSEVELAVAAADQLTAKGKAVRVVSMPCAEIFLAQDDAYRESVLPRAVTSRVAVEAGVTNYWYRFVGMTGKVIGIDSFGESAPAPEVFKHFGFTVDNVVKTVNEVIG